MRRTFLNDASPRLMLLFLILLLVCASASAQSGRRAPKATSPPAPPVQPEPTPVPAKPSPAQAQISVVVMGDTPQSLYMSFAFPEKMQRWIIKRLREGAALAVADGGSGNRPEAVKRAKRETEAFVIWVELNEDVFGPQINNTTGGRNVQRFQINYYLISPVTGKTKTSGVVRMNENSPAIMVGRSSAPPICYPDVRDRADYRLLTASLEVADRIMDKLGVPSPPPCSQREGL